MIFRHVGADLILPIKIGDPVSIQMSEELARLHRRITELSEALEDIAYMADGHRRSTARDAKGNNIALSAVLARASICLGLDERLRCAGSVFAPPGTVIE